MPGHLRTSVTWTVGNEVKGVWVETPLLEMIYGESATSDEAASGQRNNYISLLQLFVEAREPTWTTAQIQGFIAQNTQATD